MVNDDAGALTVHDAQTVVNHARWRIYEEQALARLAGVTGLSCTRLFPQSAVIQVVAWNGGMLGRARHRPDGDRSMSRRWVAVPAGSGGTLGRYRTLRGACRALASAAGHGAWTLRHVAADVPPPRPLPVRNSDTHPNAQRRP